MTFALYVPPPPKVSLEMCSDSERRVARRCCNLEAVQAALSNKELQLFVSPKALNEATTELSWNSKQIRGFIDALSVARYNASEWCLPPANGNKYGPLAADSYLMGYDKISLKENQARLPYAYLKFTVREKINAVLILSCHPSRF